MTLSIRSASAIFCDDIRHEMGNKQTYVGVYASGIDVRKAPGDGSAAVLQQLCIVASAQTPKDDPFISLVFEVRRGDELLNVIDVPSAALVALHAAAEQDANATMIQMGAYVVMQSFPVAHLQTLRVIARTEREEFLAGGALIRVHD